MPCRAAKLSFVALSALASACADHRVTYTSIPANPITTVVPVTSIVSAVVPLPTTSSVTGESTVSSSTVLPLTEPPSTPFETTIVPAPSAPLCGAASWTAQVADRAVLVRQPPTDAPAPIVIAIHGYKGTPEGLELYSELSSLDGAEAAIVAYPSGTPLDLGFGWNSGAARFATVDNDDVAIISQTVDRLAGLPCADPGRVYLVGESNGGGMALRAACDSRLTGRISGVVLVNAAVDDGVMATCSESGSSVSVLVAAGLLDRGVAYDGSRQPFLAAGAWFAAVAQTLSGCSSVLAEAQQVEHVAMIEAADCAKCAVLYAVDDGPHTWPGSFEGINGSTPGSFELTNLLGEIFAGRRDDCGGPANQ